MFEKIPLCGHFGTVDYVLPVKVNVSLEEPVGSFFFSFCNEIIMCGS